MPDDMPRGAYPHPPGLGDATRRRTRSLALKLLPLASGLAGLALAAWLLESFGIGRIAALIARAGWLGVAAVTAFHLLQMLASAAGWRAIGGPVAARPSLPIYFRLRWLREAVNNLLPVAQIGGEVIAVRLLQRGGVALAPAVAGTVADLTIEILTQLAFTLLGLGLLLHGVGSSGIAGYVAGFVAVAALVIGGFVGAQWLGLAKVLEAALLRLGAAMGWSGAAQVSGLHEALLSCYRNPGRLFWASCWHMVSWLLGGVEVCLALHFLGHDVTLSAGLVIESLGQALKAAGFAVPGALGVQEGGLIVVCQLFNVSPELAIALSLLKRLREVILGVPGLVAWQWLEAQARGRPPQASSVPR